MAAGANALGLVSSMPSGPGMIPDETIAAIARTVPPTVATFLLTSRQDAAAIVDHQRSVGTSTIQIVDRLTRGSYRDLREQLPGIKLSGHFTYRHKSRLSASCSFLTAWL